MLIMKMFLMMQNHFSLMSQLLRQLSTSGKVYTLTKNENLYVKSPSVIKPAS